MARGWTSAVLLLLAASALMSASATYTDDEIAGIKENCFPDGTGLTNAECQECIDAVNVSPSYQVNNRTYGCYQICQDESVVFDGDFPALACSACMSNADVPTAYGCQACMAVPTAYRQACINHLDNCPSDIDWVCASWTDAVAGCFKLASEGAALSQCLACISTENATMQPVGYLTTDEVHNNEDALLQPNQFGRCVWRSEQTFALLTGDWESVEGIYSMCAIDGDHGMDAMQCVACMDSVMGQEWANSAPAFAHKEYGCSEYCVKETGPGETALAGLCQECLESEYPTDAWACSLCMGNSIVDNAPCFQCMYADPYGGNATNYNWGCAMCWGIEEPSLRQLCLDCISSQEGAGTGIIGIFTESNICACVDMTLNMSIPINRTLDAFELACFMEHSDPYNPTNPGLPEDTTIPWGAEIETLADGTMTSDCIACVNNGVLYYTDAETGQTVDKRYACSEYCQDPRLIADDYQGDQCANCISSPLLVDASACKMCMESTVKIEDYEEQNYRRDECFTCAMSPHGLFANNNYGWGCAQCAQFSNDDARESCYSCLRNGCVDPCDCVQCAKNGTDCVANVDPNTCIPPPNETPCDATKFQLWTWVHTKGSGRKPVSFKYGIYRDSDIGLPQNDGNRMQWFGDLSDGLDNINTQSISSGALGGLSTWTCDEGVNCFKIASPVYSTGAEDIWAVRFDISNVPIQNLTRYWFALTDGWDSACYDLIGQGVTPTKLNCDGYQVSLDSSQAELPGDDFREYGQPSITAAPYNYNSWMNTGTGGLYEPILSTDALALWQGLPDAARPLVEQLAQTATNGFAVEIDDNCGGLAFTSLDYASNFHGWARPPQSLNNAKQIGDNVCLRSFKPRYNKGHTTDPYDFEAHPKPSPSPTP